MLLLPTLGAPTSTYRMYVHQSVRRSLQEIAIKGEKRAGGTQSKARQRIKWRGMAWHGMAWHGMAKQDKVKQGKAGQGRAGQGRAGQGRAGQGRAGQDLPQ